MRLPSKTIGFLLFFCACATSDPGLAYAGGAEGHGYTLEVVDEYGTTLPTFEYGGRTYVMGDHGRRYQVRVQNQTGRRIEAVISIDGRDALDGKPAGWDKRGYIIGPYDNVLVSGFRLNLDSVATFRFSDVPHSYAAKMGDARNVGVIGVAVFPERYVPPPPPRDYGYLPQPQHHRYSFEDDYDGAGGERAKRSAPSASPAPSVSSGRGGLAPDDLSERRNAESRPGLATAFGEQRDSRVSTTQFRRASNRPSEVLALRYNDRGGLMALGIDVDHDRYGSYDNESWRREVARPFSNRASFSSPPAGWTPEDP